jgi:hypothetical protein
MKVAGEATLHAPVEEVWKALNDPGVLVRTIPGCERLEETEPDAYRMTISAGVASIKGTYQGDVRLSDQDPPGSFVLHATGAGAPGTVTADVRVSLQQADGATRLSYDADAVVGGMIGGVGQRVLAGVAKKTAGEFFRNVDDVLTGKAVEAPTPVGASAGRGEAIMSPEGTYVRETAGARMGGDLDTFARGAAFGAVVALLGALVGGLVARRRS